MSFSYSPFSPTGKQRLLGSLVGADMNTTSDQAIVMNSTKYRVNKIVVTDVSTSLTLAAGGIYTSTAKGGSAIVAAAQVYSALTGATKTLDCTIAAIGSSDYQTGANLYLSLTVAQGSAATANLFIYGEDYV